MAVYWKPLLFALILLAVTRKCSGQLLITGHEEPLLIGLSRDIHCTWGGDANATTMEWFLVGLDAIPIETASNTNNVVLSPDPDSSGLDGAMFTCRATLSDGREVEETITLRVRAVKNTVTITPSTTTPIAGQRFTLTCSGTSDRDPQVSWIGPDGQPLPQDGQNMTVSRQARYEQKSSVVLTFNSIRTSQRGTYTCVSNIVTPPSNNQTSHVVRVQIPRPTVTIMRDPEHPVQLFTTNQLILRCVVELIPEVDSLVAINSQWSGHSALTDERRVIVSDVEGIQLVYETSVTFSSLKSSDSGSYVCSANVSPQPSLSGQLLESSRNEQTINIVVVLKVSIDVTYNPPSDFTLPSPPYYRPATAVTLTCRAHSATGPVTYRWSSTCSSCFASSSTFQSVSDSILKSHAAGVHTCTATDGDGNTGMNSTEMKLIGAGIYVDDSYYINGAAVANNTLIVQKPSTCRYCKVDVFCYSNSTSSSAGYFMFSNGVRQYSYNDYYDYKISRESPSGLNIRSYSTSTPDLWGIFTCELPDSEGNTVDTSIGIYSSMPGAPSMYSSKYTDWSSHNSSQLGTLECLTRYSPPTTITWLRDGVPVLVDGDKYEMIQTVTNRGNSYYNSTLLIRYAADLAGNHTYTCTITNNAGTTTQSIRTTMTADPVPSIETSGESTYLDAFNLTCRASLNTNIAAQLIRFLVLDWVRADEQSINQSDGITIEQQQTFSNTAIRSLLFNPLNMTHGENYKCEAKLLLPSHESFTTSIQYHMNVLNRTLIQLKFGPMVHCSKWYEDKRIAAHLEQDIKQTLVSVINENCDGCGFTMLQIDQGEFSCQTLHSSVIYRARLTGSSDTLTPPELLALIQDWVTSDGTFLYTYHGRIRLRLDPHCPLEITSFSQPECIDNRYTENGSDGKPLI